jgi:hypothetical protein
VIPSNTQGCLCPPTKVVINDVTQCFDVGDHVDVHPNTLVFCQSQHKNQCWHNKQFDQKNYYIYLPLINEQISNDFESNIHQNMGPQFPKEP